MSLPTMFSLKGSVDAELKRFKALTKSDPEKSKEIYATGEKLITLAGTGQFYQFRLFVQDINPEDIMTYFSAKALMASLIGGHLVVSRYILDHGYPLHMEKGLPNILHECLRELKDYECVSVLMLLLSKGLDINKQEPDTWLAPIHIAVSKGLHDTVKALVEAGADVNIVAAKDEMPLTLAQKLPDDDDLFQKEAITNYLIGCGARLTWRRDNNDANSHTNNGRSSSNPEKFSFSTGNTPFSSNTQVKAGESTTKRDTTTSAVGKSTNRVRFNGAMLATLTTEPVTPPAPPLPKVTVTTASGSILLPPPKVPAPKEPTGNDSSSNSNSSAQSLLKEDANKIVEIPESSKGDSTEVEVPSNLGDINSLDSVVGKMTLSDDGAMLFSTG